MRKLFYVFAIATAGLFVLGMIMTNLYLDARWPIPVFIGVGVIFLVLVQPYHKEIYKDRCKAEVKEMLQNLKEEEKCMIESAAVYTNMKLHNQNIICKTIEETLDSDK